VDAPEERLLGTEDLHGGCGVLGQIDQGTGMRNEAGSHLQQQQTPRQPNTTSRTRIEKEIQTYNFADKGAEVGGDGVHAAVQVLDQLLAEVTEANHTRCKVLDIQHVQLAELHACTQRLSYYAPKTQREERNENEKIHVISG
jgi:hypothetical protein